MKLLKTFFGRTKSIGKLPSVFSNRIYEPLEKNDKINAVGNSRIYYKKLNYEQQPKNIFIYTYGHHKETNREIENISSWLLSEKNANIVMPREIFEQLTYKRHKITEIEMKNNFFLFSNINEIKEIAKKIDLTICFGGDGTLLYLNSKFREEMPPILGFKPEKSFGFLLSYGLGEENFPQILENIFNSEAYVLERMKMEINLHKKDEVEINDCILNEIFLTRDRDVPVKIDIYVDHNYFTTTKGDGVLVSTTTGSTGYNLSCKGPAIHPCLNCFIINPINNSKPIGLKPLIINEKSEIMLKLAEESRSNCVISFDARKSENFTKDDRVIIKKSKFPCYTLVNEEYNWFKKLKNLWD